MRAQVSSLRVQLLIGYLFVILVGMGSVVAWAGPKVQHDAFEQAEHYLEIESHLLALTLAPQIEDFLAGEVDLETLRRLLPHELEDGTRVTITDSDLFIIFSNEPRVLHGFEDRHIEFLAAQRGEEQHDVRVDEITGEERIFTAAPIFGESGEAVAYIQISAPTAPVWMNIRNAWAGLGSALGGTLIVAGALGIYLSRRVTRPLAELRAAASSLMFDGAPQKFLPPQGPAEVRDLITAFNHMSERLAQIARRQRELVSGAAHELRSPLTALALRIEMLTRHPPSPQDMPGILESLTPAIHRLQRTVDQLLLLAGMEESNRVRPGPLDLAPLLYQVVEDLAPLFRQHRLDVDVPPHLPAIRANADQVRIIFTNLLDNARKHTPPRTTVRLIAAVCRDHVEVKVADDGPGISVEDQERVFERFYRGAAARSASEGSGLGLTIVRELANMNGGVVLLESTPGKGACFTVRFPIIGAR